MKKQPWSLILLLAALVLMAPTFFTSPADYSPVLHWVLSVAGCLLVIVSALLEDSKRASVTGIIAYLFTGLLWAVWALWQARSGSLVSSTLAFGSLSAYFFILAIKYIVALRSTRATRG
ncbi:MAG TPA: hypothetical protein VF914_18025 [Chloroflexia bacterium]